MSTLKIAGVENELRLDSLDSTKDDWREQLRIETDEYFILPEKLIDASLEHSPSTDALRRDIGLGLAERARLNKIIDNLNQNDMHVNPIIHEHLERDRKSKDDEAAYLQQKFQRYGFSGGYTLSGHRLYVDGTHPEICTPECSTPEDIVRWEKAGDEMIMFGIRKLQSKNERVVVYKNNSDGFRSSWGSHENYLINQKLFQYLTHENYRVLNHVQSLWISFLVTRMIYTGNGKPGYDIESLNRWSWEEKLPREIFKSDFILSQRMEYMERFVAKNTTEVRPWINTRDIPYVGEKYGRRLHVITGDSNLCEMALYLRIGAAMITLMMLEDSLDDEMWVNKWPILQNVIHSAFAVNNDISCKQELKVQINNRPARMTALDIQRHILDSAIKWYEKKCKNDHPIEKISWMPKFFERWNEVLELLGGNDREKLYGQLDWFTKYTIMEQGLKRSGNDWQDKPYLKSLDLLYHRLDEKGIFYKLKSMGKIRSIVDSDSIISAMSTPPADTRAHDRGHMIADCANDISYCCWNFVVFTDSKIIFLDNPWRC